MLTRAAHDTQTPLSLTVRNCDLGQYGSSLFCSSKVLDKIISGAKKDGVSTIFAISKWSEDIDPEAFKEQVQRLVDADLDVVIMEMVPTDKSFDPIVRARRALSEKTSPSLEVIPLQTYLARTERQRHLFAALSQSFPERVKVLSPSNELCDRDTCHFHTDGAPNYSDSNHLTHIGAENLKPMFADVFEQLGNNADPK